MEKAVINELASSMTRMYGKAKAFEWASRYVMEATASGDFMMHARWASAAADLGAGPEADARRP